jgi:8-oxo-dGTP pyrophosphatase MutT (NUDIX family)
MIGNSARWLDEHGFGLWVLTRPPSPAVAGFVGLRPRESAFEPELLYGLAPSARGQGLATEAARLVLEARFADPRTTGVWAVTDPLNQRSRAVLERLGFALEREGEFDGRPSALYRLTRARWAGSKRREAAVLVPLFRDAAGVLRIVLVRRAAGGSHGGQLAFPGGMREARDASALEAALREAEEEIGLARSAVEVLTALPVVDTRTSGYRIAPFLARIRRPARWAPAPAEVAEVLEVGVDSLRRPEAQGESVETFPTWPGPQRVSFIRVGEHRLWGASLRIVDPLLERLASGEWSL